MWQNGTVHDNLLNASRIISAVDTNLVTQMTKITEETCGTCAQIGEHADCGRPGLEIKHDLQFGRDGRECNNR